MRDYYYSRKQSSLVSYSNFERVELNETAKFIIERIEEGESLVNMPALIAESYEVSYGVAKQDVKSFVGELASKGIDLKDKTDACHSWKMHTPIVHIIQSCNSPCIMCDCWKTKRNTFHSIEMLKPFFKEIKNHGAEQIMVSGGEPLLHPELPQILECLQELGLSVSLNTNGILLGQHLYLHEAKLDELIVSMDGHDSATYKSVRGTNAFDKVWKNIKNFKENSPETEVGIRITLGRKNFKTVDKIIDLARAAGIDGIGISPADVDSKSFSRNDMEGARINELTEMMIPSKEEIITYLKEFVKGSNYYEKILEAKEEGLLIWGPSEFIKCMKFYFSIRNGVENSFSPDLCNFPFGSMVLDYNGDLKNCFYSKPFGNLYQLEKADWSCKESLDDLYESNRCSSCRGKVFCDSELIANQ